MECSGFPTLWLKIALAGVGTGRTGDRKMLATSSTVVASWLAGCSEVGFGRTGDFANPMGFSTAFCLLGDPRPTASCSIMALGLAGVAKSTEVTGGFLTGPTILLGERIDDLKGDFGQSLGNASCGSFEGLITDGAANVCAAGFSTTAFDRVLFGTFVGPPWAFAKSCTSISFFSFAGFSKPACSRSIVFKALVIFAPFFATAVFFAVEALREAVLIVNVLGAVDFDVVAFFATSSFSTLGSTATFASFLCRATFGGAVFVGGFGAAVFAVEAFVVAVLVDVDVDVFDIELFTDAVMGPTVLGPGFGAESSSAFFGLPRRTGALRMVGLGDDSGWPSFACARCARVSTITITGFV